MYYKVVAIAVGFQDLSVWLSTPLNINKIFDIGILELKVQ